jgi:hypothetical protein
MKLEMDRNLLILVRSHFLRAIKMLRLTLLAVLFTAIGAHAGRSDDSPVELPLSLEQEERAFAILDTLLPPKETFDMKNAPPTGEVRNPDGSHYTFTPMIYVPKFGKADFPKEFVARLAEKHSRVMSEEQLRALPKDGRFFYVFEDRSYLPTFFIIRHITPKEDGIAEAVVYSGAVGGAAEWRILLDRSSGQWTIKEKKIISTYD